ncbi:MAG: transmembrane domain-containing protein [Erysipelotrichaceae bacterium]|nr:transmembrane domain-containing protein [Erysipelotrichaceae bacterium]
MQTIVAILIVLVLVGLNGFLYIRNRQTPVPEGCENLKPDCAACGIGDCALRAKFMEMKEEEHGDH